MTYNTTKGVEMLDTIKQNATIGVLKTRVKMKDFTNERKEAKAVRLARKERIKEASASIRSSKEEARLAEIQNLKEKLAIEEAETPTEESYW